MRPRLKENEFNQYQLKKFFDKRLYKVLLFSDPHGWLVDQSAISCIRQILEHNDFDEVCINGDIVDMPYISRHTSKLYEDGILNGYSEVKEIEYTKEAILKPLRASTKADIRIRIGNHDERITNPVNATQSQVVRLNQLYKHYNTTSFDKMLDLSDGFIYDPSDVYTYFDKFDVVHGLSLAKNASEKNIQEYMSSGASGHTHRLNSKYITNRKAPYVWFELGCTRVRENVEYFPTAKIADWQQGFVSIVFDNRGGSTRFYGQTHVIIDGQCYYNGVLYNGNYKKELP